MKISVFIISFLITISLYAQHDRVLEIRDYYKTVKAHSGNAEQDSIWYYSDQVVRNSNNLQWRAIGVFNDTITFWYSDLMESSMKDGNHNTDSSWALVLVTSSKQMSGIMQYSEWLFKDGEFLFHYDKMNGYDAESTWEYRYYFDNGKLIRFMQGGQIISFEDDTSSILNSGKTLLAIFSSLVQF